MATLALGVAGAAIGAQVLPSVALLGGTLTGAAIGQAAGAFAGGLIDQALFGTSGQTTAVEGPRLSDLQVLSSTEGTAIPRLYGSARLAGQVIWALPIDEVATQATPSGSSGGKSIGGGGSGSGGSTTTNYSYFASFAIGLCEGEVTRIGQVWADGKPIDLSLFVTRLHTGSANQQPDSLIEATGGAGRVPAYRGLAYIVFERLALAAFGNRIPQLTFEVVRSVDGFADNVRAINIIPSSGEFAYDTLEVTRDAGGGATVAENTHSFSGGTDFTVSIDQLQAELPAVQNTSLVVAWFGDDLRAGECQIRPAVEISEKITRPYDWSVGGITRGSAHVVSVKDGRPAYGGTPADTSVIAAIRDLTARGLAVTFNPFILMDVAGGNGLPDPYGASEQAVYPWRGRITGFPATGQGSAADKTVAASSQLANFVGTAQASHFAVSGTTVEYSGPAEWSFRRFILHYAHLCVAAGGVDAFLLCSELRGLTSLRDHTGRFPFVDALIALAADVRAVLGPSTKLTYGADWSEFFGHQPSDGSGDVLFHLDPLWSAPAIDAVGIDAYWPLSDWREGRDHLDAAAGAQSVFDRTYLTGNIRGGEYFDWYYASSADRVNQQRTPITDGQGAPWIFRPKDIWSWWSNAHRDRPAGIENTGTTAWMPRSKPIWLTELGCPAVHLGANQPNVFYDPKSAESALPHFSSGRRDDLMQRRFLQVIMEFFDPADPEFSEANNPISPVYGGRMVAQERMYVYAWDARPYPAFPLATEVWSDGANWTRGHWLNGRVAGAGLDALVRAILDDFGYEGGDSTALKGFVEGYVLDRLLSVRQALQPLELGYFFDSVEGAEDISFRQRASAPVLRSLTSDELVETRADSPLLTVKRAQESELPSSARISYINPVIDYRQAASESRRLSGHSNRVATAELPIVLRDDSAQSIAEIWLHEAWAAREEASLMLPPSAMALEPGDLVDIASGGRSQTLRLVSVGIGTALEIEARSVDPSVYGFVSDAESIGQFELPAVHGPGEFAFLDLPLYARTGNPLGAFIAVNQSPWPGEVSVLRSGDGGLGSTVASIRNRATIGVLESALAAGPAGRWDHANTCDIKLSHGALSSLPDDLVLAGGNRLAVEAAPGRWELLQFAIAEAIATDRYRLRKLLRGQNGTDADMASLVAAGSRCVLIDNAVTDLTADLDDLGVPLAWRFGPVSRDVGHASWRVETHAFSGVGMRPLSPVHIRAEKLSDGVRFKWIRRTRSGGDSWQLATTPIGEISENYAVEILNAGQVIREITTSTPEAIYSTADQQADFGAPGTSFSIRVRQVSALTGPGAAADAALTVS